MPNYFELDPSDKAELLEGTRGRSPWQERMLEKDVWVVLALDALFSQPDALKYSFKGGTSLSKAYAAIYRFSEDVDITVDPDHPLILEGLDPTEAGVSKTKLKDRGDQARKHLPAYLETTLAPYLEQTAARLPEHTRPMVALGGPHRDQVHIRYPSALEPSAEPPYILGTVLLEFGARASTEPSTTLDVSTYLAQVPGLVADLILPTARPRVMRLERTFWEKATLIHFEISRNDVAIPKERYARHWYDLHQLSSDREFLQRALRDPTTLRRVMHIKRVHYGGKGVDYADCGAGRLRLTPTGALREHLEHDYQQMRESGMFVRQPPAFTHILDDLGALERELNAHFAASPVTL